MFLEYSKSMLPISGNTDYLAVKQLKTKCRRRSNLSRCQLHDCINININIKRLGTPTAPHHSLNLAWPLFPFYLILAWPSIFGQLLPLFASPRFRVGEVAPYMLGLLFFGIFMANRRSSRRTYALFTTNTAKPEISHP